MWPATIDHLREMCRFVYEEVVQGGFDPKRAGQLEVSVEEVVVNIIHYAFPDTGKGQIEISVETESKKVIIKVADEGPPFNPLEVEEPNIHLPYEKRPVGGLGLFIVRKSVDEIYYRREGNKNVLTLVKLF